MNTSIIDEVIHGLQLMPEHLQWRVLDLVRLLSGTTPSGVPERKLLRFAGIIPAEDLQIMSDAIQQGCAQVDFDEW